MLSFLHYPHLAPLQEQLQSLYTSQMWTRMISTEKSLSVSQPSTVKLEGGQLSKGRLLLRVGVVQHSTINHQYPAVSYLTENGQFWMDNNLLPIPAGYQVIDFISVTGYDTYCKLLLSGANRLLVGYCSTKIELNTFKELPLGCFLEVIPIDWDDADGVVVHPVKGEL